MFFSQLSAALDFYYDKYDNVIINGDFNLEPTNPDLTDFMVSHSLYNHMREKTCWKSSAGTCIDLILSNKKHSLMHTGTVETGLSDHHALIYTMLRSHYMKAPPRKFSYRNYKNFDRERFALDLSDRLSSDITSYAEFEEIFVKLLDEYAPLKTKVARANSQPHVSKDLRKAIMRRSQLKKVANISGNSEDFLRYKRQRNFLVIPIGTRVFGSL